MSGPMKSRIRPHRATDVGRMHQNKVRYLEADAYENAHLMNVRYPTWRFDAYPCLWCDDWHVGRKKPAS